MVIGEFFDGIGELEHLFQKHKRYIDLYGPTAYARGERYSILRLIIAVPSAVLSSLLIDLGILGGRTGIYLSFFNGWFVWKSLLSLRSYQRSTQVG